MVISSRTTLRLAMTVLQLSMILCGAKVTLVEAISSAVPWALPSQCTGMLTSALTARHSNICTSLVWPAKGNQEQAKSRVTFWDQVLDEPLTGLMRPVSVGTYRR